LISACELPDMKIRTLACMAAALPCYLPVVHAQSASDQAGSVVSMDAIKVEASADASAGGLAEPFAGGQAGPDGHAIQHHQLHQ
jgi:iron complex outermembrane receptor protein